MCTEMKSRMLTLETASLVSSPHFVIPYTKSLIDNGDGLKKDSVAAISESKDHNRIAALTYFKKVIEEVERVNAVKYTKVVVWSDGCAAQFRSRFVFRLLTDCFSKGSR